MVLLGVGSFGWGYWEGIERGGGRNGWREIKGTSSEGREIGGERERLGRKDVGLKEKRKEEGKWCFGGNGVWEEGW